MIREGYRKPTESERKEVGRFTRPLTLKGILSDWFRRCFR
jgi:hypothetical protein